MFRRTKDLGTVLMERYGPEPKLVPDFRSLKSTTVEIPGASHEGSKLVGPVVSAIALGLGLVWTLETRDVPETVSLEVPAVTLAMGKTALSDSDQR